MRYIGKHRDMKLRYDQLSLLSGVLSKLKNEKEIEEFLISLLSPSELAYMSQRLHIMKMLLNDITYQQIQHDVGTTPSTISATKIILKDVSRKYKTVIATQKIVSNNSKNAEYFKERENWINPKYPGAIR